MGIVHGSAVTVNYSLEEMPKPEQKIKVTKWIIGEEDVVGNGNAKNEVEYTLSELVAKGYQFCIRVDDWKATTIFTERMVGYEFDVMVNELRGLNILATSEMSIEEYDLIHIGDHISIQEQKATRPSRVEPLGRLGKGKSQYYFPVYVPKQSLNKRVLSVFLIDSQGICLIKARCLIVTTLELRALSALVVGGEETMAERASRIKRLVSELSERTFFRIYDQDHLASAIMLSQSLPFTPKVNYWLTFEQKTRKCHRQTNNLGLALGYKYFPGPNPQHLSANVLMIMTNSLFGDTFSRDLAVKAGCDVYVASPRGFGPSQGERGLSDSSEDIWQDVNSLVRMIKRNGRPSQNLIVGGHFWGASIVVKYQQWKKREKGINGYFLLAPNLGVAYFRSPLQHQYLSNQRNQRNAAHLSQWRQLIWNLTGGHMMGREPVLHLQSDPLIKQLDPNIVDKVSLNTYYSWHLERGKVSDYFKAFVKKGQTYIVIYGDQDEFVEESIIKQLIPNAKILPGHDNLTVINASLNLLAEWIRQDTVFKVDETTRLVQPSDEITLEINRPNEPLTTFTMKCLQHDDNTNIDSSSRLIVLTTQPNPSRPKNSPGTWFWTSAYMPIAAHYLHLNNPSAKLLLHVPKLDLSERDMLIDKEEENNIIDGYLVEHVPPPPLIRTVKKPWLLMSDPELIEKLKALQISHEDQRRQLPITTAEPTKKSTQEFSLANYDLMELIGKGSFGLVWLARQLTTGHAVAIKVIPKDKLTNPTQQAAVKMELEVLKRINNSNEEANVDDWCVKLVDYGQDNHNVYLVTEFIPGGELFVRFKRAGGKFTEDMVKLIVRQLAEALHTLHTRHKVVYRDLKPENILITKKGNLKLVDFGFAVIKSPPENGRYNDDDKDKGHHHNGEKITGFCGSPYYIAPEMLTSPTYDDKVDWWALGVLMYELLTGEPPFQGDTPNDIYRNILLGDINWCKFKPLKNDNKDNEGSVGNSSTGLDKSCCCTDECLKITKELLRTDPNKRLGYQELITSKWLREIRPDKSPFPPLSPATNGHDQFDTSNFVKFKREEQVALKEKLLKMTNNSHQSDLKKQSMTTTTTTTSKTSTSN